MNLRLSKETYERLDLQVERQRKQAVPGSRVSRHAVACWLLEEGLKAVERKARRNQQQAAD